MFMLSDQQRAISDTATRFGAEHLAPLALQWEQDRHFPAQVLREAGRLKMGGLHVGPDVGGRALSRVDAALVVEGIATGCPAIAGCLSNHNTAAWLIDTYGDRDQRYRWLPGLCALTDLAVYCMAEAGTGSDVASVRATAARDGDHYVISGVKHFVPSAGSADVYIVIARTTQSGAHGLSAFVTERDDAGHPRVVPGVVAHDMTRNHLGPHQRRPHRRVHAKVEEGRRNPVALQDREDRRRRRPGSVVEGEGNRLAGAGCVVVHAARRRGTRRGRRGRGQGRLCNERRIASQNLPGGHGPSGRDRRVPPGGGVGVGVAYAGADQRRYQHRH
jgi:Acyl-CoA dehydrogenase, N-terminal domain/Acyl-CoA dehydrogenase, middle domain